MTAVRKPALAIAPRRISVLPLAGPPSSRQVSASKILSMASNWYGRHSKPFDVLNSKWTESPTVRLSRTLYFTPYSERTSTTRQKAPLGNVTVLPLFSVLKVTIFLGVFPVHFPIARILWYCGLWCLNSAFRLFRASFGMLFFLSRIRLSRVIRAFFFDFNLAL